jgi:hypothetical protein
MSTPAAAALSGAGGAPAGGSPAGGGGAAPAGGAPAAGGPAGGSGGPAGGGGGGASANEPFYSSWIKADAPDAKDVGGWLKNKNFSDPGALVRSYRETEQSAAQLRAAAALKGYPTDVKNADGTITKADPNQVQAWRASMGVPANAADYKLEVPSNTPYPQFTQYLQEGLHEVGVPAAMAPRLAQMYEAAVTRMETELRATEDRQSQEALRQLEQEWGANYQERIAIAGRGKEWLAKEVGGLNDIQMRTLEAVLGTSKFMTAMYKMGAGNQEIKFPGGGGGGSDGKFAGGVSEAQAKYAQLQADRAAGKISTEDYRRQERELADIIAGGFPPATN